jgi:hypothetical protein
MPHTVSAANLHTERSVANSSTASSQPLIYVVRGRPGPLDRPALPSGHPVTWGGITQGTVLDQSIYPFPVYLELPQ